MVSPVYPWDAPDNLRWEDLRFPVQGINPIGAVSDPTVDSTTFPGTFLFPTNLVTLIAGVAQMPHAWHAEASIYPHIHWCKTTSAPNDVVWEFCYTVADMGEVFGAYSDWEACTNPVSTGDTANQQGVSVWSAIPMSGKRESAMVLWQIRRNVDAAGDTYAADARMLEFDIHFQNSKTGTETPFPTS